MIRSPATGAGRSTGRATCRGRRPPQPCNARSSAPRPASRGCPCTCAPAKRPTAEPATPARSTSPGETGAVLRTDPSPGTGRTPGMDLERDVAMRPRYRRMPDPIETADDNDTSRPAAIRFVDYRGDFDTYFEIKVIG